MSMGPLLHDASQMRTPIANATKISLERIPPDAAGGAGAVVGPGREGLGPQGPPVTGGLWGACATGDQGDIFLGRGARSCGVTGSGSAIASKVIRPVARKTSTDAQARPSAFGDAAV